MDSYMTISHTRLACLPSRWVSPGCSIKSYGTESHMEFCQISTADPANIRLDEDVLKTSLRRLSSSSSEDVFKTSSWRLGQDQYIRLGHTSSRRLQDVFKTSCKNVFKTSSRRLQDVFKTSSRRLQDVFKTSCKDIFKMFSRRIIKLNCSC